MGDGVSAVGSPEGDGLDEDEGDGESLGAGVLEGRTLSDGTDTVGVGTPGAGDEVGGSSDGAGGLDGAVNCGHIISGDDIRAVMPALLGAVSGPLSG